MDKTVNKARQIAWMLALAGFAPFAFLALALLFSGKTSPLHTLFLDGFRTYSAIILSFLGGIRWGMALRDDPVDHRSMAISVAPSIVGWLALFLAAPIGLPILLVAYCAQGAWDSFSIHAGKAPAWFAGLRITLTLLVALAHLLALISAY